jgi:hypothetical protein
VPVHAHWRGILRRIRSIRSYSLASGSDNAIRQLEEFIVSELGPEYLEREKNKSELRKVRKEISDTKKRLDELQIRKIELEKSLNI